MITNMSSASLEQAIIDDDIVGMAMRVLRGIDVSEATTAVDAIQRVGPGGHYLVDPHTVQFMRSGIFYPQVADRQNRAAWEEGGREGTRARAVARVEKLAQTHGSPGLPAGADAAVRSRFTILV
jgi:trimethylamine--corrinoid protein Co-methyltransferase